MLMRWEVEQAKNGCATLKCNEQYIYSKYNPKGDVYKFISQNFDQESSEYLLLGLGLGYHLELLLKLAEVKKVYVLLIDKEELNVFNMHGLNRELINKDNVTLVDRNTIDELKLDEDAQIIIPFSMLNVLPENDKLKSLLENIKLNQMSFNLNKDRLQDNFNNNIKLNDTDWRNIKNIFSGETACLISSGPSIDDMIPYLQILKETSFILSVGSALRILLKNGITPHAVIISDAKEAVQHQFTGLDYDGPLFYLATASHKVVSNHLGKRVCLFQKGYPDSEQKAEELGIELIEVGGSVATAGFSLLEYLGFKNIILCGQDLGFREGKTHSTFSTSGVYVKQPLKYKKVIANSGEQINISKSLNVYLQWFERKAKTTSVNIINTAWNGTKIEGIPYENPKEIVRKYEKCPKKNFSKIYEV